MSRLSNLISALALIFAGLLAVSLAATAIADEPSHSADHGAGHGSPDADSPYANRFDPEMPIRALTPEEIAQIERGEGAGFALPAELNGVPGPRHVLDLAHDLGLSHQQRLRVEAIHDQMQAAAIPAGERYLAAVAALEEDFRTGTLSEADLPDRVAEVSRLEGDLAGAHLLAHLQTAKALTPDQIAEYNRLRGYE